MGMYDSYGSFAGPDASSAAGSSGSGYPSIGEIQADYQNLDNIFNNNAKSADWGAAVGAGIGAFFGQPQMGANIGRTTFPILNEHVVPELGRWWGQLTKS